MQNKTNVNKSVAAKQKMICEMEQWDRMQRFFCPGHESFSLVKWFKTVKFLAWYKADFERAGFDAELQRNRPDVKKGSKEYRKLYNDAIYCYFCYGTHVDDFFEMRLYEKNHRRLDNEIFKGRRYRIYVRFNGKIVLDELDAKCDCYQTFREFYHRDAVSVLGLSDRQAFTDFFDIHEKGIIKPNREYGGHGIRIVTRDEIRSDPGLFERLVEELSEFLVEELIVQSEEMSRFNESSVNTVRIETLLRKGKAVVLFAFFRYGGEGKLTDNVSGGGNSVQVDPKNGVTFSNYYHGTCDPVTGRQIIGVRLPEWEQLVQRSCAAAEKLPQYHLLAFDFAHSQRDGWVMVEANSHGQSMAMHMDEAERFLKEI